MSQLDFPARDHAAARPAPVQEPAATGPDGSVLFALGDVQVDAGGQTVLGPVSLDLPAGRMTGLIGPNGSGKSTLLSVLGRQRAPSSGTVRFNGRPIGGWQRRGFARQVAYLPQTPPPTGSMTVRELAALGRYPWHGALGRFTDADRAKVADALAQAAMTGFAERFVDSLSGGERQRAWLAMLLAQDTRCLLLDEPTAALDVAHQVEVLELVRARVRATQMTAIVAIHDLNMAARTCDDLIALRGGRMLARGRPGALMRATTLYDLYGIPMGVLAHPKTQAPIAYVR
ncbi:iron-hydroxamate transporter ATP-binding subunit [Rhodovibrio sodomensis]|uniref:Iron-hydroxamate transporter ATP-binding subunit n=1 Tax=Rhodovibrio sodomensis TaxID=1088 RepID=A0ABS1DKA3_9PROT|nr:ATP-binding cassette domain-containing protein [Rhodovibrio sodomensis]MBK1670148.1 iron-hydroxamate transporter ATP-binding subunit [Rhodovibrio sodomensis]